MVKPSVKYAFMIHRPFWQQRMESSWAKAPIVWLSGVRRSGKTTLIRQGFADASVRYVNCDDPRTEEISRFPMDYLRGVGERVLAFDEIHRLPDPSRVLKLAADEFPSLRVLATGSSTLGAARTFSDALTGRKRAVPLTPVLWSELPAFGVGVEDRLLRGGLPPALLARERDAGFLRGVDGFLFFPGHRPPLRCAGRFAVHPVAAPAVAAERRLGGGRPRSPGTPACLGPRS